jgi:hypothetical protein
MSELALAEPVAGHTPYYKKQGIEKFLDEDDRVRKHCMSLIESGVEVDDLVAYSQHFILSATYKWAK